MCGIYGKIRLDGGPAAVQEGIRLAELMRHRGPDDSGSYADGSVFMAHRRLSVIDLSPRGRQPMSSEDGSIVCVLNGEIYNFRALRRRLECQGYRFRSDTDTEVLVHLFEAEGIGCLRHLRGMFAFAIWNARSRSLFLARDRVGKKPLFYCHTREFLAFASELRPLVEDPEITPEVDREALHHYLTLQSVPAPLTAYRGIRRLCPAHWVELAGGNLRFERYWRLDYRQKLSIDSRRRRRELEERLESLLDESVRLRLEADVPLGVLLSGGVDSSLVAAMAARAAPTTSLKTFSVGFSEEEYDELAWARRVAVLVGAEHHEYVLRPKAADVLPMLVEHFGEPFADPAAIPLYYITKVARDLVTVVLCGDGGDEAFGGYERHRLNVAMRLLPRLPSGLERMLKLVAERGALPRKWAALLRRALALYSLDPVTRNLYLHGHFELADKQRLYSREFAAECAGAATEDLVRRHSRGALAADPLEAILAGDIETHLPDTLLPKTDITSMANSVEVRSPLLDHELLELAATIPHSLKVRTWSTKWILRRTAARLLPGDVVGRRKRGFAVPLGSWFRNELRDLVRDVLLSGRCLQRGLFVPEGVRRLVEEHETGERAWERQIYSLLLLELWYQRFIDGRAR